jgi:hypothetical protein
MIELELFAGIFLALGLVVGILNGLPKSRLQREPSQEAVLAVIATAKQKMARSRALRHIDAFGALLEEILDLRRHLVNSNQWPTKGAEILRQIAETADVYVLAGESTIGFEHVRKGSEETILNLLSRIRSERAAVIGNQISISTSSPVTEPEMDETCSDLVRHIEQDVERGLKIGGDDLSPDLLLLRGVKIDYLPQTLAAYAAAHGHPEAESRLREQLEKLHHHTNGAADRLAGNPLGPLNINQRFLNEKFGRDE